MVEFAGWSMPVQYSGIIEEHQAVRHHVGVFDISHMGEIFVRGPEAETWLNSILTNDVCKLGLGEGQYTLMLNEKGGVLDDLILYRLDRAQFLLVVNASRIAADFAWMESQRQGAQVELEEASNKWGALAVQGPEAPRIYAELFGHSLPGRNRLETYRLPGGEMSYLGITGYTGEAGFEFFLPAALTREWFDRLLDLGVKPCGLGARDTLRLEMGYPLCGSDLLPNRTPIEAGLSFFISMQKGPFTGKTALEKVLQRKYDHLVGIMLDGKAPPLRPHYPLFFENFRLGETTSGALSPSLGTSIGMAYLPPSFCRLGGHLEVEIRGKKFPARVVKKPFYKKSTP
jgi:aminomethyltransferase